MNPYRVIAEFMRAVDPRDAIVTHDSGSPRDQLLPFYRAVSPRSYLGWGKSHALGTGLGLIIGAKLAAPDKFCVNFMGDAAFGMTGLDFETAVRCGIPILTVVLNNSSMAIEIPHLVVSHDKYGTRDIGGRYADLARAMGGWSERVERPEDIAGAFGRARKATEGGQAALLEFITSQETRFSTSRRAAVGQATDTRGRLPMTRIAYFNGKFVPETEVLIPYRDRSFNRGDGCFDMTRTFDGRIFRLEEHVERLYRSLRYLRIDIGLEPKEIVAISEEVVERNEPLRAAAGDWWLAQRVSRGVDAIGDEGWAHTGPQVIVDCTPLPLKARGGPVPRRHRRGGALDPPHSAADAEPARQDPQLPEPHPGRQGGQGRAAPRRGRCCSTRTATSARGSAATSSWCATSGSTPRARSTCCPESAGGRRWSWPPSSAFRARSATSTSTTRSPPTRCS